MVIAVIITASQALSLKHLLEPQHPPQKEGLVMPIL